MATNEGFSAAVDYFSAGGNLSVVSSSDGIGGQLATATDENGDELVRDAYGEVMAPTAEYKLKGEVATLPALGTVTESGQKKVMVETISISTGAGSEPTVSISGKEVESTAVTGRTFAVAFSPALLPRHKAQVLLGAFTPPLSSTGCALEKCDLELSSTVDVSTETGAPIYSDCFGGKATVKATIIQTGATPPTITAGTGWTISSPLASSSPDADYIEWTVELVKSLEVTEAVQA